MNTLYRWITRGAIIALIGVILSIVALALFLYRSYYHSVTFTQRIADLRGEVTLVEIDEARTKKIIERLTWQAALPPLDPKKINNPFK
ncbi:hypothetical protein HY624_01010 [Candidatus Uhrbacteria bacterium]|nr:hypothetical protein [Candidatus Uhrbacteria bacterium]